MDENDEEKTKTTRTPLVDYPILAKAGKFAILCN